MKKVLTVTIIVIAQLLMSTVQAQQVHAQQEALFGASIYTSPQAELKRKEAQILKRIDPKGAQSALSITLSESNKDPAQTPRASLNAQKHVVAAQGLTLPEKILVDREAYLKEAELLTKAANEIERLQKINQGLESTIKALEARVAAIRKVKDQEESKVNAANKRAKELLTMITESKKDLVIAETEVRRLSGVLPEKKPKIKSTTKTSKSITLSERRSNGEDRSENQASVVSVEVDKANLRAGPGKNHSALMTVKRGTRLVVETRQNDWLRITAPSGSRAWVSTDVVAFIGNNDKHSSVKIKGFDSKADQVEKAFKLIRARK